MNEKAQGSGFIAIYRWDVESKYEDEFRNRWHDFTLKGRELGSLGSCLTNDKAGNYVAIAFWPSEEARAEAFKKIDVALSWQGARRLSEEQLFIVDDLWVLSPFQSIL